MDKYTRNDFEENYQQPDTFQEPFVGRVDLSPNENGTPFFVQDKIHKNEKTNYSNAMQGLMENSLLSITFFSAKNIESIQNTLRSKIFNLTNGQYKIDVQDNDQLKIIMRSVFLQYSSNNNDNIVLPIYAFLKETNKTEIFGWIRKLILNENRDIEIKKQLSPKEKKCFMFYCDIMIWIWF